MHDGVEGIFPEDFEKAVAVGQVAADELRARIDRLDVARHQRIENGDGVTVVKHVFGTGAADVARAAGDEDIHIWSLLVTVRVSGSWRRVRACRLRSSS
ncbi:hypothetical protein SDC9_178881 [bioreactor metagenome]|uniref:Uncharacterized protein n=1 Tax=bioreactor metagenome TaxID=1076179 RepID=A0A645GXF7_9ZZZZ